MSKKINVIIGIDIGVKGAIAVLKDSGTAIGLYSIPVLQMELKSKTKPKMKKDGTIVPGVPKKRTIYHEYELYELFKKLQSMYNIETVCIERPIAMAKQTIITTATSFEGFGIIKGLLMGLGINHTPIEAKVWSAYFFKHKLKKHLNETPSIFYSRKKKRNIKRAKSLFPQMFNLIGRNDGFADALLIALYKYKELYNDDIPF